MLGGGGMVVGRAIRGDGCMMRDGGGGYDETVGA